MSLLDLASNNSFWRGNDYYENKRVNNIIKINEITYSAEVVGSNNYQVTINIERPRNSTCNCAFASGRKVICKHMVALYWTLFPSEGERIIKEAEEYEEEFKKKQYNEVKEYVKKLSAKEAKEMLVNYILEEKNRRWY